MNIREQDETGAVAVKPVGDGFGVFAARPLAAGAVIGRFAGAETSARTRMSLQFGADLHIEPGADEPLRYLNHACEPTAVFSGVVLTARVALAAGAEITIDYTCHEPTLSHPFSCRCGAPGCLGTVRGWNRLDAAQQAARRDRAGAWLLPDPGAEAARMMHCRRTG